MYLPIHLKIINPLHVYINTTFLRKIALLCKTETMAENDTVLHFFANLFLVSLNTGQLDSLSASPLSLL